MAKLDDVHSNYTVYMHITPSGKKYVGITSKTLEERWNYSHGYDTQVFGRAIRKYGWDNIQHITVAENLSYEWACQLEKLLIRQYRCKNPDFGYNLSDGGESGCAGVVLSEETRKKMSSAHKGKHQSEETRRKIGEASTGRVFYSAAREKISQALKGKPKSKEHAEKARTVCKGRIWVNDGAISKMIYPDELQRHLDNNYTLGRIKWK